MKKLAIIGKGTAGALAVAWFSNLKKYNITWYYDSKQKPQAVGEGAQLNLPPLLYDTLDWTFKDYQSVDGNYKTGIHYRNWGEKGDFMHNFLPPQVSMHFNAVKLQDYIFEKFKDTVNIIDQKVSSNDIRDQYDFVFDCSGKPDSYYDFHYSKFIPVNSAYITQCYWDAPEFDWTVTCARKYGWVFGIPLQNRCSIGYLYNKNITSSEEVKEDVQEVFKDYNLTPSDTTNSLSFSNYYRKQNFVDNVAYCGNSSFFLEPMEATSILTMEWIMRKATDLWDDLVDHDTANTEYLNWNKECEHIIMMHYAAGSKWDNDFWDIAQYKGQQCLENARQYPKWNDFCSIAMSDEFPDISAQYGGGWAYHSFAENLKGLGLV